MESRPNRDVRVLKQHKLVMPGQSQDRSAGQQDSRTVSREGKEPSRGALLLVREGTERKRGVGGRELVSTRQQSMVVDACELALSKPEVSTGLSQH